MSGVISKKDNDIKGLKLINTEKTKQNIKLNDKLIKVENLVKILQDENKIIKMNSDEKEKSITLLKEEIDVLESIIAEKDQTINLLSGDE